ncbi:AraC family transcriptional regulator [bacterium]|nr:MAG: AraC family transcriptional regulator [bacterium]
MDAELVRRLERVRERLAEEPLSLEEAAREAYLSPFHFHRQFARAFGQTPHEFATAARLERAKQLLLATELPVTDIVLKVGYESQGSFGTRFVREYGVTPTEFRRGARRLWQLGGIRSHRFVPLCFVQNGKIREAASRPQTLG